MTTCLSWLSLAAQVKPDQERGRGATAQHNCRPITNACPSASLLIALGCVVRESPWPSRAVSGPGRSLRLGVASSEPHRSARGRNDALSQELNQKDVGCQSLGLRVRWKEGFWLA